MREKLKACRNAAGLTQAETARRLGISLRYYCRVESGESMGSIPLWDALEDLLGVNQRALRLQGPGGSRP